MYHFQPYVSARNDAVTTAAAAAALCGYSAASAHHHHFAAAAAASAMPMQNYLLPNALASLSIGGSHMIGGGLATANTMPAVAIAKTTSKDSNMKVTLDNRDLWSKFHDNTCEMIITRAGRRMFPTIKIGITGLDPEEHYRVVMDIVPVDDCRYKYHNSEWVASGKADPHPAGKYFEHQDAPAKGAQFMRQTLSFHKLKLTNNNFDQHGHPPQIILNSMHKYQPRIHIIRDSDMPYLHMSVINTFTFPETIFIAVTAYQNEQITQLKIDNNPFAKGFRDLKTSRRNQEFYELVHYTQQRTATNQPPYSSNGQQQQSSSTSTTLNSAQQLNEQQLTGVDNSGDRPLSGSSNSRKRTIDTTTEHNGTVKHEKSKHHRSSTEEVDKQTAATSFSHEASPKYDQQKLLAAAGQQSPTSTVEQRQLQDETFTYPRQSATNQLSYLQQTERFNRNQQHDAMLAAQQQQQSSSYYSYQQHQRNAAAMQSFMSSADPGNNFGLAAAAAAAAAQQQQQQHPHSSIYSNHQHFGTPHHQTSAASVQHHHNHLQQPNWNANPYAAAAAAAAAAYPAANSYNSLQFAAHALQSAAAGHAAWNNSGETAANVSPTQPSLVENHINGNFQTSSPQQQRLNYSSSVSSSFPVSATSFGGLGISPPASNNVLSDSFQQNFAPQQHHQQQLCDTTPATTAASLLTAAAVAAVHGAPPITMMMNQFRPAPVNPHNNSVIMPTTNYGIAEIAARALQSQQFP